MYQAPKTQLCGLQLKKKKERGTKKKKRKKICRVIRIKKSTAFLTKTLLFLHFPL